MQPPRLLHVLLIEDIDDIRLILQYALETLAGWFVTAAASNQDWRAKVQSDRPDVILLDEPEHSLDILTRLKQDPLTQHIPIVCLVSRDRHADQQRAQQDGIITLIAKPFDPITLIQTLIQIVESSNSADPMSSNPIDTH